MANTIRIGNPCGFNKGHSSKKFRGGLCCGNSNKDEDNSLKTLNDKRDSKSFLVNRLINKHYHLPIYCIQCKVGQVFHNVNESYLQEIIHIIIDGPRASSIWNGCTTQSRMTGKNLFTQGIWKDQFTDTSVFSILQHKISTRNVLYLNNSNIYERSYLLIQFSSAIWIFLLFIELW